MTDAAACGVDDVIITAELARRPARQPDFAGENAALLALAEAMTDAPDTMLQRLAGQAMALTGSGSAGISLLEDGGRQFRWVATAGALADNLHGTMPRDESPCGIVVARAELILVSRPARAFPALGQAKAPIVEGLIAPFSVGGRPAGTVWVLKHETDGRFDAEDARILQSLARFASAGSLVLAERDAALRDSEARFRAFVTASSDAVYRMSPDWSRMHVLDGQGFIADTSAPDTGWMDRYILADDRPMVRAAIDAAIRDRTMFELEHRVVRADGTPGWTRSRAVPILDDAGKIVEWLGAASDVTGQRELADRYSALFESIDEGFCVIEMLFDADGAPCDYRFLEYNPAFERQTGLADAIGRRMRELAPEHEQFWFDVYGEIAATGQPRRFEHRADALGRWYDGYALRVGDPGQHRVAILFRDILPRKQAEAALREREERFRQFGANSLDVLWISDADTGRLEYLSPAFESVFGEPCEAVIRDPARWRGLVHPDDLAMAETARPQALGGKPTTIEYRIVRPADGAMRWVRDSGFPLLGRDGRVERIAGIVHDFTDEKAALDRQRMLHAELQHRVRNTLSIVRSIVRRTAQGSEDVETMTAHLTGRLDAFARVQTMVTRDPTRGIDLKALIEDELIAHAAREGEALRIAGPELLVAPRSAEALALAVHELATNAVKYGALAGRGGRIRILWTVSDDRARLRLCWEESGVRGPVPHDDRQGFGVDLLRQGLPYDLDAQTTLEFRDGGLLFTLDMPLAQPGA